MIRKSHENVPIMDEKPEMRQDGQPGMLRNTRQYRNIKSASALEV